MKTTHHLFATFTLAFFIVSTATVRAQDLSFLTNGLVAYYPLNGDASDHSGYGNDGTCINVAAVADRFGIPGGAVSFNGIDSYAEIPQSPQFAWLEQTNEVTISAWFAYSVSALTGLYICKYNPSDDGKWEIDLNPVGRRGCFGPSAWIYMSTALT